MTDIMIDIETLSTRHDAAILSIGLCSFDIQSGTIGQGYHEKIIMEDNALTGHISAETISWWFKQTKEAQEQLLEGEHVHLAVALNRLWYWTYEANNIWSNGSSFDLVILRSAYQRCSRPTPWKYWQERDTRTIVDIAERITGINAAKVLQFTGTKHDALADAIHQAKYVSYAYELLSQDK